MFSISKSADLYDNSLHSTLIVTETFHCHFPCYFVFTASFSFNNKGKSLLSAWWNLAIFRLLSSASLGTFWSFPITRTESKTRGIRRDVTRWVVVGRTLGSYDFISQSSSILLVDVYTSSILLVNVYMRCNKTFCTSDIFIGVGFLFYILFMWYSNVENLIEYLNEVFGIIFTCINIKIKV